MMMGRHFSYGFGPYGCGILPMLLIFLVLGILIFFLFRYHQRSATSNHHDSHAVEILNERLAKGEISADEYEKIKKVIK